MIKLAFNIKKQREENNLQLQDLAKLVGISSSALSQIENAKTIPSLKTLESIAIALNTTIDNLIKDSSLLENSFLVNEIELVKYNDIRFICKNKTGAHLYSLSHPDDQSCNLEVYLIRFKKKSDSTSFFKVHKGKEICHLLKGDLKFKLDNNTYNLKAGDILNYNSEKKRKAVNYGQGDAELLWIVYSF